MTARRSPRWMNTRHRGHRPPALRPVLEALDDRLLLSGVPIANGDVLVGINGGIQWRRSDGTLVSTLPTSTMFSTGMAFGPDGDLYATSFTSNSITRYDSAGNILGTFASGFSGHPESIVFDANGNAFVGQADGFRTVLEFDPTGKQIGSYSVKVESRGSDWIELGPDQHTLYYTSNGHTIKRYDISTHQQLPDFATGLPGDEAYALRLLPDGTMLVADDHSVLRLNSSGTIIQTYAYGASNHWFALNLAPDGTSFWTADQQSGQVARFDIASGAMLTSFNTGKGGAFGLVVRGEVQLASAAALTITQVNPTPETYVGNSVTYTFQVSNQGAASAADVTLAVALPPGASYVSGTSSIGGGALSFQNNVVTYDLASLPTGTTDTVSLVVQAGAAGPLVLSAAASTSTPNATLGLASLSTTTNVLSLPIVASDSGSTSHDQAQSQGDPSTVRVATSSASRRGNIILVHFSQDMSAAQVQRVANYQITGPLSRHRIRARAVRPIPIRRVLYNPTTHTAILIPQVRLKPYWGYQLTISSGLSAPAIVSLGALGK